MPNIGMTEILIIAGILILLFGATKLPKLARSLGESARIFKAETKGMREDDQSDESDKKKDDARKEDARADSGSKQLPESKQQEPLVAETVEEHEHKRAS